MDDENPLMRPIKAAFFERATRHAELLQHEVDQGRISTAEATQRLIETMSQPEEMEAVIAASIANQTPH